MTEARFRAELQQAAGKSATGIEVPDEVVGRLGSKRAAVRVTLDGHEFRTTIGTMAGRSMIPVSAATRAAAGLAAGDEVEVTLVLDETPRDVDVPADLAAALDAAPGTRSFFEGLSNSLQRYHVDQINGAKAEETRRRRIEKAIALFAAGRSR